MAEIKKGKGISTGQPPPGHGQVIGTAKCIFKEKRHDGWLVSFRTFSDTNPGEGSASWVLSEEDAEYYVVGQLYSVSFTTP